MTTAEAIKRAAEAIATGSAYRPVVIEALIASLCELARAEGKVEGAEEARAAVLAQLAMTKAAMQ